MRRVAVPLDSPGLSGSGFRRLARHLERDPAGEQGAGPAGLAQLGAGIQRRDFDAHAGLVPSGLQLDQLGQRHAGIDVGLLLQRHVGRGPRWVGGGWVFSPQLGRVGPAAIDLEGGEAVERVKVEVDLFLAHVLQHQPEFQRLTGLEGGLLDPGDGQQATHGTRRLDCRNVDSGPGLGLWLDLGFGCGLVRLANRLLLRLRRGQFLQHRPDVVGQPVVVADGAEVGRDHLQPVALAARQIEYVLLAWADRHLGKSARLADVAPVVNHQLLALQLALEHLGQLDPRLIGLDQMVPGDGHDAVGDGDDASPRDGSGQQDLFLQRPGAFAGQRGSGGERQPQQPQEWEQ